MRFNPFAHLIEINKRASTRFLRSTFWLRVTDSFRVFFGSGLPDLLSGDHEEADPDLGLLDYLNPLARLFQNIFTFLVEGAPKAFLRLCLFAITAVPVVLLTAALNLLNFVAASLFTLITLPILSITHFFFGSEHSEISKALDRTQITLVRPDKFNRPADEDLTTADLEDSTEPLETMLTFNHSWAMVNSQLISAKKLMIKPLYKSPQANSFHYKKEGPLSLPPSPADEVFLGLVEREVDFLDPMTADYDAPTRYDQEYHPGKVLGVIKVVPENYAGISALLKTNTFWATETMENDKILEKMESLVAQAKP